MLEGEYLEMCEDLQKKFTEKDLEMEKIKEKYEDLKKSFLSAYGFVRILDYNAQLDELEMRGLLEILRAYMSDIYDEL